MNGLLGVAAANQRNEVDASVITGVEATSTGDVLVHTGHVMVRNPGRVSPSKTIRLTADDLAHLIGALQLAQQAVAS